MKTAEEHLLHYTASAEFEQMKYMNWTTAEVIEQMESYARSEAVLFGYFVRDKIESGGKGIRMDEYFDEYLKSK